MSVLFIGVGDAGCAVAEKLRQMQPEGMKFMKVCKREEWLEKHEPGLDCPTVSLLDPDIKGLSPGCGKELFKNRAELHADEIREKIQAAFGMPNADSQHN